MINRLTFDDLLNKGGSSPEKFKIEPKRGKLRVKKKQKKLYPDLYENESALKKAGADFLQKLPRCRLLKTDNQPLIVGRGRRVKTREPGMADQHLCIRGLFVAIEGKMPGKDLDPDQVDYKADIQQAGGIFILYHAVSELIEEMKKYKLITGNYD